VRELGQRRRRTYFAIDQPGMGKSCALTKLELETRNEPDLNNSARIILRVNLNKVQNLLGGISSENQLSPRMFIERFGPVIPLQLIDQINESIPLYILLDGLDEVIRSTRKSCLEFSRNYCLKIKSTINMLVCIKPK